MDAQIKVAYEQEAMSCEEIAESFGLEVETVKLSLQQHSARYRRDCRIDPAGRAINDVEADEMLGIIKTIARSQIDQNPGVAVKAAIYAREDLKGRQDARIRAIGKPQGQVNVIVFNEQIQNTRRRMAEMKQAVGLITHKPNEEPIDIEVAQAV